MIFELFISFALLSVIFIALGYYVDIKVLAVLGFATLFFLGLLLQFNGVTQRTGDVKTFIYSNATLTTEVVSYSYSTINDSTSVWIGRWLSIVSALGVALVFASNKRDD